MKLEPWKRPLKRYRQLTTILGVYPVNSSIFLTKSHLTMGCSTTSSSVQWHRTTSRHTKGSHEQWRVYGQNVDSLKVYESTRTTKRYMARVGRRETRKVTRRHENKDDNENKSAFAESKLLVPFQLSYQTHQKRGCTSSEDECCIECLRHRTRCIKCEFTPFECGVLSQRCQFIFRSWSHLNVLDFFCGENIRTGTRTPTGKDNCGWVSKKSSF